MTISCSIKITEDVKQIFMSVSSLSYVSWTRREIILRCSILRGKWKDNLPPKRCSLIFMCITLLIIWAVVFCCVCVCILIEQLSCCTFLCKAILVHFKQRYSTDHWGNNRHCRAPVRFKYISKLFSCCVCMWCSCINVSPELKVHC